MKKAIGACLMMAALAAAAQTPGWRPPAVRQFDGIPYLSGGVSEEEQNDVLQMAKDFNMELVFAEKGGAYLADVEVVVIDGKGKAVLDARSQGPFFLARLPAGTYRVVARVNDDTVRKTIAVSERKRVMAVLYWNKYPG